MRGVLALLLMSFVAYATETTITMNLTESRELLPDHLSMNLPVTAKAQKESEVINILGNVDKAVRSLESGKRAEAQTNRLSKRANR